MMLAAAFLLHPPCLADILLGVAYALCNLVTLHTFYYCLAKSALA